jgi:hypothetical protein
MVRPVVGPAMSNYRYLPYQQPLEVLSRNEDMTWYLLQFIDITDMDEDSDISERLSGWVRGDLISLESSVPCENVPLDPSFYTPTPTATSTPTVTPTITPTFTPIPTSNPSLRDVHPNAEFFHNYGNAERYGLPLPFTRLPYNDIQPNQADNPLIGYVIQGYGGTAFAVNNRLTNYDNTFGIHSGIDYGTGDNQWSNRVVVSLCDGVVIGGRPTSNGGSANPGRGVSVRCFIAPLDSGRADSDGDGNPNLSNIVVVYNHLLDPLEISCTYLTECQTGQTEYPVAILGDIVYVGTPLGQTRIVSGFDHLHLEVYFARGYQRPGGAGIFNLNPLLMYTEQVANLHNFYNYFPRSGIIGPALVGSNNELRLGIQDGQLSAWTLGAFNLARGTEPDFWAVQTYEPDGEIEWSYGMYPILPGNHSASITTLDEALSIQYAAFPFVSPNCPIQERRITAQCDMSDLTSDQYVEVPHQ